MKAEHVATLAKAGDLPVEKVQFIVDLAEKLINEKAPAKEADDFTARVERVRELCKRVDIMPWTTHSRRDFALQVLAILDGADGGGT